MIRHYNHGRLEKIPGNALNLISWFFPMANGYPVKDMAWWGACRNNQAKHILLI